MDCTQLEYAHPGSVAKRMHPNNDWSNEMHKPNDLNELSTLTDLCGPHKEHWSQWNAHSCNAHMWFRWQSNYCTCKQWMKQWRAQTEWHHGLNTLIDHGPHKQHWQFVTSVSNHILSFIVTSYYPWIYASCKPQQRLLSEHCKPHLARKQKGALFLCACCLKKKAQRTRGSYSPVVKDAITKSSIDLTPIQFQLRPVNLF